MRERHVERERERERRENIPCLVKAKLFSIDKRIEIPRIQYDNQEIYL